MAAAGYQWNDRVVGLSCLRCGKRYDPGDEWVDRGIGCGSCLEQGYPASLRLDYRAEQEWQVEPGAAGMARYAAHLPYITFPSLGEGATSLVRLSTLARSAGIGELWVKNEGQNPTGSHKDRMSAQVVARAAALGRRSVVATSSGNAGASLAAYAAAARLRCTIISTRDISAVWARAIEIAGAELVLTDTAIGRWHIMRQMVEEEGRYPAVNYLDPPVGSNPFGVQGYKTVAYEIVEQCGGSWPTMIAVPTSRGDLLWGMWQGLLDCRQRGLLQELPRLVAVEPVPRLSRVLGGEDYRQPFAEESHDMTSIGGTTATHQSTVALAESRGCAVEVSTPEAREAQQALGRLGFYAELSSAAALAGLWHLKARGQLEVSDRVVLVLTSHGYKEVPVRA